MQACYIIVPLFNTSQHAHRRVGRDGGSRSPHRGGTRDRLHQRVIQVQHVLVRRLQHGWEGTHGRHGGEIWFALCVLRVLRVRLGNLLWLSKVHPSRLKQQLFLGFSGFLKIFWDILRAFLDFRVWRMRLLWPARDFKNDSASP